MSIPTPCRAAMIALALGGVACGGASIEPTPVTLPVINKSAFEMLELRVHEDPDPTFAVNLLSAPLAEEEAFEVPEFTSGSYVTVVRVLVERGDPIAITTAQGLDTPDPGYTLWVFEDGFRLWEPGAAP